MSSFVSYHCFDCCLLACLFLVHHALVKGELLALQDVSVAPSALSRSGGDNGQDTSGGELGVEGRVEGAVDLSGLELLGDGCRDGTQVDGLAGFGAVLGLFDSDLDSVVGLVPGLEGVGVDHDNGPLDEGLGADQFVVGRVVHDVQDTDLAGADLGTPGKVSGIQSEGSELGVSSPAADLVDAGLADLGHGRGPSEIVLSLLAELGSASSGFPALVSSFASDTLR